MITFKHGTPDKSKLNASVTFGDDKEATNCLADRDAEGNITVVMDVELEPEVNTPVFLVLHSENHGEYRGVLGRSEKGDLIFKG